MKFFRKSPHPSLPYLVLLIAPLLSACGGSEVKENNASVRLVSPKPVASERYVIDKKESVVTWKGSMQFPSANAHIGYVYVSTGELLVEKGQLVGGTVAIDMNTIADKDHGSKNNLVDHLKSADFFEVEKFPISTFAITIVAQVNGENVVTGILTIKGIMQTITFPAKIDVQDGIVTASGNVTIDRTKWDVRYKSGKFYDNLADEAISDDIEFQMKIVARK